jgi:hypothetical protein
MSIHLKGVGSTLNTQIVKNSVEKNTQSSNINTAKNFAQISNNKRIESSTHQSKNQNTKVNNINYAKSHCVTNLNITKMHIDKLHSEKINKLYNRNITKKHASETFKHDDEFHENQHQRKHEFDEPKLSDLDVYHIGIIKNLYFNMESNNPRFEHYVIIIIYETIHNTNLINKQLITAIPIENDIPKKSITEITIINNQGKVARHTKTICFHIGGLVYTDDWLKIEQTEKLNSDSTFYKFKIDYQGKILNGIALNNILNSSFSLNNSTIYIPNFTSIWC